MGVSGPEDEDAAQDVEVKLVFWDGAEQPGLEEGGPLPLQSPLAAPVALHTHTHRRQELGSSAARQQLQNISSHHAGAEEPQQDLILHQQQDKIT